MAQTYDHLFFPRVLVSVSVAFILGFMGVSVGHAGDTAGPAPAIRSGAEIDYPPFSIVDENGKAGGFSVELMRAALAAMARNVDFRTGPWAEVRGWLERGEIQALPLVGRTPEREILFDFTVPYMTLHGAIVVRDGETGIRDLADLRGRRVAVMKGDTAEEFLRREERGLDIHTTPTFEAALRELSEGRFDAVVIQRLVALRLIQKSGLTDLRIVDQPVEGFQQNFCFAVREGDRETLDLLNEGLAIVVADGTFRYLHAKWFAAMQLPSDRPIVVGGDRNFPPYEFLDENGRPAGYNVDLTRAIAREMGLHVEIRLGRWSERLDALKTGKIDVMQGMFYSPRRDLTFDFTQAHIVNHCVAVVRKGDGVPPGSMDELSGMRLVVEKCDIFHDFVLENGLEKQTVAVADQETALRELSKGTYDCALVSRTTALYFIDKYGWTNLVPGGKPLRVYEYCYAAVKGQKALLAHFSEGLKALESSGEYRRIYDKWLGLYKQRATPLLVALRYSAIVVGPLLVILLIAFFWSWTLRRQVGEKTRALSESEERYRLLADNTLDVIWTMNLRHEFTYVNPAITALTGHTPAEWIGSRLPDHCDEENSAVMSRVIADEMDKGPESAGVIFETDLLKKTGEPVPVEIHGRVIFDAAGQPAGVQGVTRDITERKRSRLHIEHLNQVLRAIRDINQLIVRQRDRDRLIREGCRLLVANRGYSSALIVLTNDQDRPVSWAIEGLAATSEKLAALLERNTLPACCRLAGAKNDVLVVEDRDVVCADCRIADDCAGSQFLCAPLTHDGERLGYLAAAAAYRLVDDEERGLFGEMAGDFAYALNVMQAEEARREIEAALGDSESRFKMFAELAPVGILIADEKDNMLYANARFTELFGYTMDDIPKARQWWGLAYPDKTLRNRVLGEWREAVEEAKRTGLEIKPMEYPVTCRDGSIRHIEFRMAATDKLTVVVFTDTSARKRAEAEHERLHSQLIQAQKMESIGRLAGGVAHDYSNMLSVIIGFTELALDKTPPDDPLYEDLNEILSAARRSTNITRQLLAFARRQTIDPDVLDLNETVEGMLKMLRRLIGEDIDLAWRPGRALMPVFMDPSQVDQLLANLCVNARDAIGGVGKITIETGNVLFDADYCADHPGFSPGDFVMLAVSDDGCGMEREALDNLFEPFFTTKGVGEGTGLGLSTVYGIVKQNKGFINVYSEPEKGSTFRVYLPCHAGEMVRTKAESEIEIPAGQGETVLLVEDEASILKLAKAILETLGYNVLTATSPVRAMNLVEQHAGGIHLLVTDVVMPEMNGRELAENLRAHHPMLKVLFMSGYTANVIAHRGVLDKGVNFIQKPFSKRELAIKVRGALEV